MVNKEIQLSFKISIFKSGIERIIGLVLLILS